MEKVNSPTKYFIYEMIFATTIVATNCNNSCNDRQLATPNTNRILAKLFLINIHNWKSFAWNVIPFPKKIMSKKCNKKWQPEVQHSHLLVFPFRRGENYKCTISTKWQLSHCTKWYKHAMKRWLTITHGNSDQKHFQNGTKKKNFFTALTMCGKETLLWHIS